MENKIEKTLEYSMVFIVGMIAALVMVSPHFIKEDYNFDNLSSKSYVNLKQIKFYPDKIIIEVPNSSPGIIGDTGSMKPTLDENSHGINIVPKNESQIHVGSIIVYKNEDHLIVHRVVAIKNDSYGVYYTLKGDHNKIADPVKVRFSDVAYINIGVIY
jgi:signal peptidase I